MMLILLFLLLLSIPKEIYGIYCIYSEEPFEMELDKFDFDEFKTQVDAFPGYDYRDDNIEMCRVEIYIDYQSNELVISFGDSFQWSKLNHGEGRLDSLFVFDENNTQAEIYNVLEYACYDQHQCNKLFVFYHINWLKQVNYTLFQTHLRSLLFSNFNKTEYCITDKQQPSKCSSGVCSGKYSSYYKTYFFECHENAQALIEIHITTSMIIIDENIPNEINIGKHQIIRYTCKFNQCNSQTFTDKLINIVEKYFHLTSMKYALVYSYLEYHDNRMINNSNSFNLSEQILTSTEKEELPLIERPIQNDKNEELPLTEPPIHNDIPYNIAQKCFYTLINLILTLLLINFI